VVYSDVDEMSVPFVLYRLVEDAFMLPWWEEPPPRVLVLVFALVFALRPVEAAEWEDVPNSPVLGAEAVSGESYSSGALWSAANSSNMFSSKLSRGLIRTDVCRVGQVCYK
jgi:hypothetical protein